MLGATGGVEQSRGRTRWWLGLATLGVLVAAVVVVRETVGGSSATPACPVGRPTATMIAHSADMMVTAAPVSPDAPITYVLNVDFEVTNEASAPIIVHAIDVGVVGDPDSYVVARGGAQGEIAPGATATISGSGHVLRLGVGPPPVPDSGSIVLEANWADPDVAHCEI